jgi:hypothetical protein
MRAARDATRPMMTIDVAPTARTGIQRRRAEGRDSNDESRTTTPDDDGFERWRRRARDSRRTRARESVDYRAFKRSSSDLDDDGCADSAQFAKATCLNVKGASMSKMPSHCTTLSGELNT